MNRRVEEQSLTNQQGGYGECMTPYEVVSSKALMFLKQNVSFLAFRE